MVLASARWVVFNGTMATQRFVVHMSRALAGLVISQANSSRSLEAANRRELLDRATNARERKNIRIDIALRRPAEWPTEDHLMGAALRARLAAPDLSREWEPLTDKERVALSLPGMWPGSERPGEDLSSPCAFTVDYDLLWQARLAAWRISEPWINRILAEGLGYLPWLTEAQRARRAELGTNVLTSGAIARQALQHYLPGKTTAGSSKLNSAESKHK